ncbi:hypothetical protein BH24ACT25_BH24ACT25_11770 [soil metagenome]
MAAPGDLDRTFSGDGKVTTDFGGSAFARAVAIQPDRKIVAVGRPPNRLGGGFAVARYTPSGALDPTFGAGGRVLGRFGDDFSDGAFDVAIQDDGRIVVVGTANNSTFAIARLLPTGESDPSFSGDGIQTVSFSDAEDDQDMASGVAIDSQGRIVVIGTHHSNDTRSYSFFAVARLKLDGSLDRSFSGDGRTLIDPDRVGLAPANHGEDVAIQPDGRLLLVGGTGTYKSLFALVRLRSDGGLDRTFGEAGVVRHSFGDGATAYAVDIQSDGRIVVVGEHNSSDASQPPTRPALVRYRPSGRLDRTFSRDGRQTTEFSGREGSFQDVAIRGKTIVAAGIAGGRMGVARYLLSGRLDRRFSGDGRRTIDFGDGRDGAYGLDVYRNGRAVLAGFHRGSNARRDFALARLEG